MTHFLVRNKLTIVIAAASEQGTGALIINNVIFDRNRFCKVVVTSLFMNLIAGILDDLL
jgi:hypothetical protein